MTESLRAKLTAMLEAHYRDGDWSVERVNGTVEAAGYGGVTWIGRAVVPEDFESDAFERELVELADRRMPGGGELCPLELLPDPECAEQLRELLRRTRLSDRPHVSVYSVAI